MSTLFTPRVPASGNDKSPHKGPPLGSDPKVPFAKVLSSRASSSTIPHSLRPFPSPSVVIPPKFSPDSSRTRVLHVTSYLTWESKRSRVPVLDPKTWAVVSYRRFGSELYDRLASVTSVSPEFPLDRPCGFQEEHELNVQCVERSPSRSQVWIETGEPCKG